MVRTSARVKIMEVEMTSNIVMMLMTKSEELFQRAGKSRPAGDLEIFVSSKKWISSQPLCCAGWRLMGIDGE